MAIQFIKSARPGKTITWYVYAWKNGPLILKATGPKKPTLKPEHHAKIGEAWQAEHKPNPSTLTSIIRAWKPDSPEWKALADSTKGLWGGQLDLIEARWGTKPISVWNDPRMVSKVVKWRDERAATPRSADVGITVLKQLLEFARLRGLVTINVARDIPTLYKGGDRSEIIWTADDMERFRLAAIADNALHIYDGLRLCAVTGLRRADLVSLTWDHLGEFCIVKTALKKSRGKRRRATIPLTKELEEVLADLRTRPRQEGVNTVLVSSRGTPWTGMGYGTSFNRIRNLAGIVHKEEGEADRTKHLHDVRGTFCTLLLTECSLTDREAADIMAWSPERVGNIRKVYVDQSRVIVAIGKRMTAKHGAKHSA
jgi:integrase